MIRTNRRTPFGRALAELRGRVDERMSHMAENVGVSTSFLSALELGRKQVSKELVDKIVSKYNITGEDEQRYRRLAEMSGISIRMNIEDASDMKREFVADFARNLDDMDDEQIQKFKDLLEKTKA